MEKPLWTKDFTIITLGTVISMFGSAVSGFAMGLLVLDYTNSTMLYSLYMVCYFLPRVIMPILVGPYLDRFSRKKVIYTLDFFSAALFTAAFFVLRTGYFNYPIFLCVCMTIGAVDSVYSVAYDSFYPQLISEGNFSRAYAVSTMIYPLATTIMVPVAAYCYKVIGVAPLFLFNAVSFLIAAIAETQISTVEKHIEAATQTARRFWSDMKDGLAYIKNEKGLLAITVYFAINTLLCSAAGVLALPWLKASDIGVEGYAYIMAAATVGRLIGALIHYRRKVPVNRKFAVALFVYLAICVLDGSYLYLPFWVMLLFNFLVGIMGVTSYNIRISATQHYVPDEIRGRFNGTFQMLSMLGGTIGQLAAGALGEFFDAPLVIAWSMGLCVAAILLLIAGNREEIKKIYNQEV